ncbi:MAG: 30S ribosomal protein S5 [Nanoarchaeota archaeon]|nr:MAG: 30S ribosomal protein S5 [Nanoarchaeota archaeon]
MVDEKAVEKALDVIIAPAVEPGVIVDNKNSFDKNNFDKESWKPKTSIGKKVKSGEITSLNEIIDSGQRIMESEIVDSFMPALSSDMIMIGQAKGKFGGGQRRAFKQTQKKTAEGNKPKFATLIVIGNKDGFVGMGYGKAKETVPAREKAMRNAKINIFKIRRGCGSWQCGCGEPHSIPFAVEGKCGSVQIRLMPAPKGTGLRIQGELQKIFVAAGVKDVWSSALGQTRSTLNLVSACEAALKKLSKTKVNERQAASIGMIEGSISGARNE